MIKTAISCSCFLSCRVVKLEEFGEVVHEARVISVNASSHAAGCSAIVCLLSLTRFSDTLITDNLNHTPASMRKILPRAIDIINLTSKNIQFIPPPRYSLSVRIHV